jgi:hypothetical protein
MSDHFNDERSLDRDTSRPVMRSLTADEAYNFYGITKAQWKRLKASVLRGSKHFWTKRGLKEPEGWMVEQRNGWKTESAMRAKRSRAETLGAKKKL